MARSSLSLLIGKPRTLGGGKRVWRSTLYAPGSGYKLYRVTFKEESDAGTWEWTSRTASKEDEARELFARVEAALDAQQAAPARQRVQARRDGNALADAYLEDSRERNKAARTVEQRESILRAHVRPVLGELPVSRWRLEHSRKVISNAQKTVRSVVRLGDIRTVMSGMRTIAWRQGWLDRSIDPLEGLDLPRQEELHGVGKGYVPEELRPERHQVDAMTRAADHLTVNGPEPLRRLPLFGTKIRVAGYGGLRLGEQNALRAIDIFFNRGHVSVNGSWTRPREADAKR